MHIFQNNNGLSHSELSTWTFKNYFQGDCKMNLPDSIASWCLWLFFLWYGLAAFVPALNTDIFKKIGGALALGFVLFNLLAM